MAPGGYIVDKYMEPDKLTLCFSRSISSYEAARLNDFLVKLEEENKMLKNQVNGLQTELFRLRSESNRRRR